MKITKISLALLATAAAFGIDNLFLLPQQNADKITDKSSKEVYGSLGKAMETEEGLALLGDPAQLPDATTAGGVSLINELLQFTQRVLEAAVAAGFTTTSTVWNDVVTELAAWLAIEVAPEVVAETTVETPTAEQEAPALTDTQVETIVAEAETTPQGEAAIAEVIAVAEEITGIELSPAAALGVLTAEKTAKATAAASQINEALLVRAEEAYKALHDVLEMGGANREILARLSQSAHAALPATIEVEQPA